MKLLKCLMTLFVLGQVVIAQDDQVSFKYRTYSLGSAIDGVICASGRDGFKVDIPGGRRSEGYQYKGPKIISFYDAEAIAEARASEKPMKPVGQVNAPNGAQSVLFLFHEKSKGAGGMKYHVVAMEDDPSLFRNGMMMFLNATGQTLYMKVGKEGKMTSKVVRPMAPITYSLPDGFKGNLKLVLAVKGKSGKFAEVYNSRVFPTTSTRDIYFIWKKESPGKGHKVKINTLRERGDVAASHLKDQE